MDAPKSGTGVFYQVMPGVSADGKKVMKLIPGVLVNGKFVHTPGIKLQTGATPQKLLPANRLPAQMAKKMVLDPPLAQQVIKKVCCLNAAPSQVGVKVDNVPYKQPAPQKFFLLNKPFGASEKGVPSLPMVIKAPVLPRGPNIQSQTPKYFILKRPSTETVPAANEKPHFLSQLPVTGKSMALPTGIPPTTEVHRVPASELPSEIKKQGVTTLPRLPSESGSGPDNGSDPGSDLPSVVNVTPITTARQRAAPPAPKVPHESSYKYLPRPGMQGTTKQLKLVRKAPQGPNGPCKWVIEEVDATAPEDAPPVTPEAPLALAGRMESVEHDVIAPRSDPNSSPSKSGSGHNDNVMVCNGKVFVMTKKSSSPSVARELSKPQSVQCKNNKDSSRGTPDRFEEVIDLCGDEDDNGDNHVLPSTSQDDDNVIFVSYVPPKPEATDLQLAEQSKRSDGCAALPGWTGDIDLGGSAEVAALRSPEALNPRKPSGQEVEEEVVEEEQAPGGTEMSRDPVSSCSSLPSSPTFTPGRSSDHQLRQMFDITADVRIHLQRVDDPLAWHQVSSLLCHPSRCLLPRGEAQQEPSAATAAHVACLHHSRNSLTCSLVPHSPPGMCELTAGASFIEPIEEDFLSGDENQAADDTWQPNENTSTTSRGGRTRKRTRCPCCVPGSGAPAAKSATRWSEAEPAAARRSGKTNRPATDKKRPDSD